jgi:hypothetical protein
LPEVSKFKPSSTLTSSTDKSLLSSFHVSLTGLQTLYKMGLILSNEDFTSSAKLPAISLACFSGTLTSTNVPS